MSNIKTILEERFNEAIASAFPDIGEIAEITESTNASYGDYQCNSAMKMAKQLQMPPQKVAQQILAHVDLEGMADLPKIQGPGFINITLTTDYVAKELDEAYHDPKLGVVPPSHPKRIVVEFSSPNIAKEMHVGHLRSTIIGDCLARLLAYIGHHVIRLNHVGDWGTQFGMLINYIKTEHPGLIGGSEEATLSDLMQWYKASKVKFDEDAAFKKASQLEVVRLQGGDQESEKYWQLMCEISRRGYQEIYDLLDIHLTERGESYYNAHLPEIVKDLSDKGLLELSEGAKCVFVDEYKNREGKPQPLIVQKSDGGYTYGTTDLAALRHRIKDERADEIIYVVDAGQSLHFQLVFKVAERAGYFDPYRHQVTHVPFGLVLGADKKKFRTRSGETERLIDLLLAAIEKADEILQEKNPEMEPKERAVLARQIGLSAVKYADLSVHRTSDYQFSYEKMLKFEGNTAAFILYAFVRVQGIMRQAHVKEVEDVPFTLTHPQEIALAKKLLQFPEMLDQAAKDLAPNRITDYLFTLGEQFSAFFRDCRVVGDERQAVRLKLCDMTARTLKSGLNLLGIQEVYKM